MQNIKKNSIDYWDKLQNKSIQIRVGNCVFVFFCTKTLFWVSKYADDIQINWRKMAVRFWLCQMIRFRLEIQWKMCKWISSIKIRTIAKTMWILCESPGKTNTIKRTLRETEAHGVNVCVFVCVSVRLNRQNSTAQRHNTNTMKLVKRWSCFS